MSKEIKKEMKELEMMKKNIKDDLTFVINSYYQNKEKEKKEKKYFSINDY